MPYASLEEAYAPLVPDQNEGYSNSMKPLPKAQTPMDRPSSSLMPASSTTGLPEAPAVESTVEFAKASEHIKNSVFSPNLPHIPVTYHQMNGCQDFRVHLRNCPACMEYMKELMTQSPGQSRKSDIKETFLNMFDQDKDPLIDVIAMIGIGVLIIFVLDSFVRLGKSLGG